MRDLIAHHVKSLKDHVTEFKARQNFTWSLKQIQGSFSNGYGFMRD